MGAVPTVFPAVSAWTLPFVPPLVTSVETSFLSGVRQGLETTPYLSGETRSGVANLLRRDKPLRLIADALMISLASDWVKRQEERFGAGQVVSKWHGAERLFEPLTDHCPPPSVSDFEIKKSRFIEDFGHLDLMSRAFLEVKLPVECLLEAGTDFLLADMAFLDDGLRPLGMYTSNRVDLVHGQSEVVFRFFSPTVLELGLYVFLGIDAPKFCLAGGVLPAKTANEIHKSGYHTVALPLHRRKAHGIWIKPLAFAWHDLCHGAHWATHETPSQRMAATLLYESACRTLNGERKMDNVALSLGRLVDLELSGNGGVAGILAGLRQSLQPSSFGALVQDFNVRLESFAGLQSGLQVAEIRDQIAPWLLPQL